MEIAADATNRINSCYISMNKRLKKILKRFLYVHLFIGLALGFTHCRFSKYAEKSYAKAQKQKPFDVIIVPGVPYEKAKTNSVMTLRLYWAKHLYDSGYAKNIIFSGSSVYTHFVEGIAMKIMADSLGIPSDHTFYETKAEHSTENVYYSLKMAKEKGFQKIALATDPYQSAMLRSFIRRHCPEVKQIPIVFKLLDIDDRSLPKIDTTAAYASDFVSLMERESFWDRLRGTLGKRVIEDKKIVRREKEIARREKVSASTGN